MYVMAFRDLVNAAKKNSPDKVIPTAPMQPKNLVEATESEKPVSKKDISYKDQANQGFAGPVNHRVYKDSEIKGFVPSTSGTQRRTFGERTSSDPRHGSIIRNIASTSGANAQMSGGANWEECKHRKTSTGKEFCAEYHSICYKEKCKRARK
jgi:hypothetical protein